MKTIKTGLSLLLCLALFACATPPQAPQKQELILGAWQAEFEGQRMTLVYGTEQVSVREFGISFPYEWLDSDHIRLNAMGQEVVSRVEFDGRDLMRQTSDGVTQELRRTQ